MHSRILQHSPVAPLRGLTPVLRPPGHGRCRIEPDLGSLCRCWRSRAIWRVQTSYRASGWTGGCLTPRNVCGSATQCLSPHFIAESTWLPSKTRSHATTVQAAVTVLNSPLLDEEDRVFIDASLNAAISQVQLEIEAAEESGDIRAIKMEIEALEAPPDLVEENDDGDGPCSATKRRGLAAKRGRTAKGSDS
jgi:hypothetical protein